MKPIFTRQLYWSGEDAIKLVQEAEKIMTRERWSFNRILQEALIEYVKRHKEGNVSFQLDTFGVTWTKAKSVNADLKSLTLGSCGFKGCQKEAVVRAVFLQTGKEYNLCRFHLQETKSTQWQRKNWKITLGI